MVVVKLPDGRNANFPDNMSRDDIKSFIFEKFNKKTEMPIVSEDDKHSISDRSEAYDKKYANGNVRNALKTLSTQDVGEALALGTEKALSGASLGLYDLANRKATSAINKYAGSNFKNYNERSEQNSRLAEDAGLGAAEKTAGFATEMVSNVGGAGGALYKALEKMGLKGVKLAATAGGVEGGVLGATSADTLGDALRNSAVGAVLGAPFGAVGDLAVRGAMTLPKLFNKNKYGKEIAIKELRNVVGDEALDKLVADAVSADRTLLEVADTKTSRMAQKSRQQTQGAADILEDNIVKISKSQPDKTRVLIDDILGKRTKAQNIDEIIGKTQEVAQPIYDKLSKIGDLTEYQLKNALKSQGYSDKAASEFITKNPNARFKDGKVYYGYAKAPKKDVLPEAKEYDLGRKAKDYIPTLKSIRRNMQKNDTEISFGIKDNKIDYEHFLSDETRRKNITTLPKTIKEPDIVVDGTHNGKQRTYNLKEYARQQGKPSLYDMVIRAENDTIINKIPRKGTKGLREVAKVLKNASDQPAPVATHQTSIRGASNSSDASDSVTPLGAFVKDNELIQQEIKLIRKDKSYEKEIRAAGDTDFRILDEVKKNLDKDIYNLKHSLAGQDSSKAMRLMDANKKLVNYVDEIVPDYKKARRVYEAKGKALSAQKYGEEMFDPKVSPEQLYRKLRQMQPFERQSLATGIRQKIYSNVGSKENEAITMKMFANRNNESKLRLALGKTQANRLIDYAEKELMRNRNFGDLISGSQTAEKQGMRDATEGFVEVAKNPTGATGYILDALFSPFKESKNVAVAEYMTAPAKSLSRELMQAREKEKRAVMTNLLRQAAPYAGAEVAQIE